MTVFVMHPSRVHGRRTPGNGSIGRRRLFGHSLLESLVDLVVPAVCAACGRSLPSIPAGGRSPGVRPPSIPDGSGAAGRAPGVARCLCEECQESFLDARDRCPRCGEPGALPPHRGCRRHGFREIAVVGGYDGGLRSAVLRSKRPAGEPLAGALGRLWVACHAERCRTWGVEAVVPVPMHWLRRLGRGGSPADRIAAAVAADLRLPLVRGLRRWKATPMQNELPRQDRQANVAGAFRAAGRRLAGRSILLVDDVFTTGATLAACARAAGQGGAKRVYAAAIARADGSG